MSAADRITDDSGEGCAEIVVADGERSALQIKPTTASDATDVEAEAVQIERAAGRGKVQRAVLDGQRIAKLEDAGVDDRVAGEGVGGVEDERSRAVFRQSATSADGLIDDESVGGIGDVESAIKARPVHCMRVEIGDPRAEDAHRAALEIDAARCAGDVAVIGDCQRAGFQDSPAGIAIAAGQDE